MAAGEVSAARGASACPGLREGTQGAAGGQAVGYTRRMLTGSGLWSGLYCLAEVAELDWGWDPSYLCSTSAGSHTTGLVYVKV